MTRIALFHLAYLVPLAACGNAGPASSPRVASVPPMNPEVWAGNYHYGPLRGPTISIAVRNDGRFVWSHVGCIGLYGHYEGAVSEQGGVLRFEVETVAEDPMSGRFEDSLVVVPWGDDVFLVPPDEIEVFCKKARTGDALMDWGNCSREYAHRGPKTFTGWSSSGACRPLA